MSEFQAASSYQYVTLVDRAMTGGCEIVHDGVRIPFKPGEIERPVPQFLAEWLFTVDQQKVHTTDGRFVNRFAVKDPPPELLQIDEHIGDMEPIEIQHRAEGWDTDRYASDRGPTRVIQLQRRPEDHANLGASATGFSGKER